MPTSSAGYPVQRHHTISKRILLYGALTIVVVLLYIFVVILLQALFRMVTGQSSDVAIVVSTLGIVAVVNPLRKRIQRLLDQRF
jgi:cobalamin biosynthesis protein CobD/CbiB